MMARRNEWSYLMEGVCTNFKTVTTYHNPIPFVEALAVELMLHHHTTTFVEAFMVMVMAVLLVVIITMVMGQHAIKKKMPWIALRVQLGVVFAARSSGQSAVILLQLAKLRSSSDQRRYVDATTTSTVAGWIAVAFCA